MFILLQAIGRKPGRYASWGEGCGVRVQNVVATDEGRWRLNATNGDAVAAGWTEVLVTKATPTYSAPQISLLDGQTNTEVELTSLDNSYCVVAQPFSESSLVPGHCRVTLDRTSRAVQGNWDVLLGLPGRVSELHVQRQVAVEVERLDMGYIRDTNTNKLHLYCNILHTTKNITFCRFQKTSSSSGYNVVDGLSDGTHSYYGNGFLYRECGMTIENPSAQDEGTWRCSVGVQQWVGTQVQTQTPLQALISVSPTGRSTTNIQSEEISTVFVQEHDSFRVMCRADVSLSYCWFQHPNGTQFTPVPLVHQEQAFWYTGESLKTGDCGIIFSHATKEEAGIWTCHMGPNDASLEITDKVEVRVTGPLAANKKQIVTTIGSTITLYCHSSNGNRPLNYCRFLTPYDLGFRLDSTVTEENALFDRYYFTPGRDLDYGDCSLTIKTVQDEDIGEWTCAALIDQDSEEARDVVTVLLNIDESRAPLSQAGIVGMAVGLSTLVVLLAGVAAYKTGWPAKLWRRNIPPPSHTDAFSLDTVSANSRNSQSSADSDYHVTVNTQRN
ncbi:uncharacterized protein LOC126366044 isoform X2 [Pectinophora gossypiella]|uniref:uncharacterized protein LOC126366044 isoform X2 n=1 Tax=Pectinophora gossypiella TaxID=13191 RepID=UPI00214E976C|nr:uncharacterized protein LOC126366044 isoform X2 [Pectinophora gossypiella]